MDGFLRVNSNAGTSSPSSFNTDNADTTSICPLITPSPPTNALVDPVPEPIQVNYQIGEELAVKLQKVQGDGDSISSASSSEQPVTSQLLDGPSFLSMPGDTEITEEGKTTPLELTFRNPAEDYFFMSWNWPLIRKVSLYFYLSILVGMLALVIGLIATLPKTCNPPTQWYQGNLFYEIFPASFYSSNKGMVGNLKGISKKADYLMKLGVRGVRLNSIFPSANYPHDYENATELTAIDDNLGSVDDFRAMTQLLKSKNISVILDLPLSSPALQTMSSEPKQSPKKFPLFIPRNQLKNDSDEQSSLQHTTADFDPVEGAIQYWKLNGVEGFYLKGLENYAEDYDTARLVRKWKKLLGQNKILIVSEDVIHLTPKENLNIILNNVDLVDVKLDIEKNASEIIAHIDAVQNGTLFAKPGRPWVHWSIANAKTGRLANIPPFGNATLGATLLQLMLPGTPSIFYGDEIGLNEVPDPHGDRREEEHLRKLAPMTWKNEPKLKTLPWNGGHGKNIAHYEQIEAVIKMVELRSKSPSIYMNAVYKQGVNKANAEVKYSYGNFLVIQRWFPRRKSFVVASNLGQVHISEDLSSMLYSGQVIVGPRVDSVPESITFKQISLWPGESVVIVLD